MFAQILVAGSAIVAAVSALPMPPPGTCIVDLNGTPYTSLALRTEPCNTAPVIVYLSNGQSLQDLGNSAYGCGWEYEYVQYTDPHGNVYTGWAGSDFMDCGSTPPPNPPAQQSCGSWAVQYGGSPNACGDGYEYTASDGAMCDASGDNCQSVCCTPNKVYRRMA